MEFMNVDDRLEKTDWVSTKREEDLITGSAVTLHEEYVPNVLNMGAQDAVYLIEKCGMYVQVYGKGKVQSQSVVAGSKVHKGATVVLTLR